MTGLTGSGKTTVFNKIHTEVVLTEILTSGFSVEMLSHPYTSIAAFDVGGENIIPSLYMQHFRSMKSLISVVDRNDRN
ncbi:PREDICTED: ADP-ribosylation factor [Prunus dulcis]|uniref:PREDICTED: ADP-ribosylation factor n=1 Tax=Prunus dulcis TaxID=3755 RepID=A0A5E4FQS1_PRUDU|nr:PREDICTED: ADP-ribosylation factor [Prunus dulcis]